MRKIFDEFKKLNKYARQILFIGTILVLWTFIASITFYCLAGIRGDYHSFMSISSELAVSAKSGAGIVCISAFICQFINIK